MKKAEREAHRAWLARLKAGDEVAVQETEGLKHVGAPSIHTVDSVGDHSLYVSSARHGRPLVFDKTTGVRPRDVFNNRAILLTVTDEVRRAKRIADGRGWLSAAGWSFWSRFPDAVVEQVLATLAEHERSNGEAVKP